MTGQAAVGLDNLGMAKLVGIAEAAAGPDTPAVAASPATQLPTQRRDQPDASGVVQG
jgi:hypothetical protein